MFIAVQFTTAKTKKQPTYQPKDEWIKKMCYMYSMEHYLAIKNNEICDKMDPAGNHYAY